MISNDTYEEVYQILKCMDKLSVMKIPNNILNKIVKNRNPNFKTKIIKTDLFNVENISIEAKDILCWLTYNYWMTEIEKEEINKINYNFYLKQEEEKSKKYEREVLFRNNRFYNNSNNALGLTLVKEKNIIKRIIIKIKKFLNK